MLVIFFELRHGCPPCRLFYTFHIPIGRAIFGQPQARLASTYIRKTNIIFVGEKTEKPHELPAIEDRSKLHLKKKKKPIVTEVHVPSYALIGKMHAEVWQELLDTIETDEGFLPMTNVAISPALISGESRFSFVAINKDQVIYIGESIA